jgi:hypothetical protein
LLSSLCDAYFTPSVSLLSSFVMWRIHHFLGFLALIIRYVTHTSLSRFPCCHHSSCDAYITPFPCCHHPLCDAYFTPSVSLLSSFLMWRIHHSLGFLSVIARKVAHVLPLEY